MSCYEIEEYHELENQIKENLENQYAYFITVGDMINAHEAVKSLMDFKLIPRDDPRADKNTKIFSGSGDNFVNVKDRSNYGLYDYRKEQSYEFIPRYLFCNLKSVGQVEATVKEHDVMRVEGNYQGVIHVESFKIPVKLRLVDTYKGAERAVADIYSLCKNKSFSNKDQTIEEVKVGVLRIYKITALKSAIYKDEDFGYIITKADNTGKMVVRSVLNFKAINNCYIDKDEFMRNLQNEAFRCIPNGHDFKNIIAQNDNG